MVINEQRYTVEEFHVYVEKPENRDRLFELINGEIVRKTSSFTASRIAARIGYLLLGYVDQNEVGYVTGAAGSYTLSPEHEFMPDVGYISKDRLPQEPEREVQGAPDLAVEVKSPTDSKRGMRQKAEDYLRFGTKMVWLVFPEEKRIEIYEPDLDVREFGIDDTLDGVDMLPDFKLAVREIFPQ